MPVRGSFSGTRTAIIDAKYEWDAITNLAFEWVNQTDGGESRYYDPKITERFLYAAITSEQPIKIMCPRFLEGTEAEQHWVGIGVFIKDGQVTVSFSDSLHSDATYESLTPEQRIAIDTIAEPFEAILGDDVRKEVYGHTWGQTNWLKKDEESPLSCGIFALENMRRSLEGAPEANEEENPGSLALRDKHLAQMTSHLAITTSSTSDLLMERVKRFDQEHSGESFDESSIASLRREADFNDAVKFESEGADESVIETLNRYLGIVRKQAEKEINFQRNLRELQAEIGTEALKQFIEGRCEVNQELMSILEYKGDDFALQISLLAAQSALPTLTPDICDRLIHEVDSSINSPFRSMEASKMVEADAHVAEKMQAEGEAQQEALRRMEDSYAQMMKKLQDEEDARYREECRQRENADARLAKEMLEADERQFAAMQRQEQEDAHMAAAEQKKEDRAAPAAAEEIREESEPVAKLRGAIRANEEYSAQLELAQEAYDKSSKLWRLGTWQSDPGHTDQIVRLKQEHAKLTAKLKKEPKKLRKGIRRSRSAEIRGSKEAAEKGRRRSRSQSSSRDGPR